MRVINKRRKLVFLRSFSSRLPTVSFLSSKIAMAHRLPHLLLIIVTLTMAEDLRSLRLSKVSNMKYQCGVPGCSASTLIAGSSLRDCQIACISHIHCRTITFEEATHQCELFTDTPNRRGNMSAQAGVLTMIAIGDQEVSTCTYDRLENGRLFESYSLKIKV
jgi:hypothetical protein